MGDKSKGIYKKFIVTRTDGTSKPGKKHYDCGYFVLDLDHDPHAIVALKAYAESCKADGYHELAQDLKLKVFQMECHFHGVLDDPMQR
jgi:hypothetical protein